MCFISEAYFNKRSYSPKEWLSKKELVNKSKKEDYLRCASGCRVTVVKESSYTNSHGTQVHRSSHFRHVNSISNTTCEVLKKYGSKGESSEHLNTKRIVASMNVTFARVCHYSRCDNSIEVQPDPSWTSKMEVRLNKWLFDVVYFDGDEIKVVIEVMHTHATVGKKREWAMQQPFEFIEVPASESDYLRVIDMKGLFLCGGSTCPVEESDRKEAGERRQRAEQYRRMAEEARREEREARNRAFSLHQLQKFHKLKEEIECEQRDRKHYQIERKRKRDEVERQRLLEHSRMLVDKWKKFGKRIQKRYKQIIRRYVTEIGKNIKTQRRKDRLDMKKEEEASRVMRYLSNIGCDKNYDQTDNAWEKLWRYYRTDKYTIIPYGELRGCDVYQVIYAYPHLINLICGHGGRNRLKEKFPLVYKSIIEITNGIPLKEKENNKYIKRNPIPRKWYKYYPVFHEALVKFSKDKNIYVTI